LGAAVCVVNVRMIPSAYWANATLCLKCSYDEETRNRFIANFAPLRIVSAYLNRTLPDARIGFFLMNAESPSGYTGYSRSGNWHDWATFTKLRAAEDADAVHAVVRAYRLTHIVYSATEPGATNETIRAFAARHTTPTLRLGDYVVAAVTPG
jgi:hypothetical protein